MGEAQLLVTQSKDRRLRDRRLPPMPTQGTPVRAPPAAQAAGRATPLLTDYDSNLRRRRQSLKGTELLKEYVKMQAPPQQDPRSNRALHLLGRVAGVAWGGLPLRVFLKDLWPNWTPSKPVLAFLHLLTYALDIVFALGSLALAALWLFCTVIDELHLVWFWASSLKSSHSAYVADLTGESRPSSRIDAPQPFAKAAAPFKLSLEEQQERIIRIMLAAGTDSDKENAGENATGDRMTTVSSTNDYHLHSNDTRGPVYWKCSNWFKELAFKVYAFILNSLARVYVGKMASLSVSDFRSYLSIRNPPIAPLSANDEMYKFDDEQSRFQLAMLFVTERLTYEEFKEAYIRRWVMWEPKTRSVLTKYRGRWAWKTLDYTEFNINQHIRHVTDVNLREKSIAEVISELSTCDQPLCVPQWEVWFVDAGKGAPGGADCKGAYSLICSKWNHAYVDGVGMMASIVSRFGDEPVSFESLPKDYRRVIPKWQQRCYYLYHALFAATESLQFLLYSAFGTQPYKGLFNASGYVGFSTTGVKHYSTPVVVYKSKLQELSVKMQAAALQKYVERSAPPRRALTSPPAKPTINDLLCYCLINAIGQLKCQPRAQYLISRILGVEGNSPHWHLTKAAEPEVANIIIPMMCRTSLPECMDNYTSLVPTTLPLPEVPAWQCCQEGAELSRELVLNRVYEIKGCIDHMKAQNCRVALFLIMCGICKALPFTWARWVFRRAYRNMQFCSTNVAAPSIDATFCDKVVHALFFWPAVSSGSTCGSSWVSLGDEIHVNSVVDEAEFRSAVEESTRLLAAHGRPILSERDLTYLLAEIADLLPQLIREELERLYTVFGD